MIIVKCIKNVEKELEVINSELERELSKSSHNAELIVELKKEKSNLEKYLENYKKSLKELNEIESRIYYKIVYEGISVMKAIEKVAEENYLNGVKPTNVQWIHTKIFPNVKKRLIFSKTR